MGLIVMNACIEETAAQKRSPKFKTREAITEQDLTIFHERQRFHSKKPLLRKKYEKRLAEIPLSYMNLSYRKTIATDIRI